jgi:hypothetical protein
MMIPIFVWVIDSNQMSAGWATRPAAGCPQEIGCDSEGDQRPSRGEAIRDGADDPDAST